MTVEAKDPAPAAATGFEAAVAGEAGRKPLEAVRGRAMAWLLVCTKAFQEKLAKDNLERQAALFGPGFEVYLPQKLFKHPRRKCLETAPFFPRYLFVRVDLRLASWKRIWSTRGVQGVMGSSAERPFAIADWVIERTRQQEDGGFIRMGLEVDQAAIRARNAGFTEGQVVRAAGMPLEAVFVEFVDDKRASILVSLLGRDSRVTVDLAKLRSATGD